VNQRTAVQNHADYVVEEGRESVGDRNCDEEQRVRQEVFGARSLDLGPLLKKPKAPPKPMTMDITVTTKTLNPKRVWRRPYTSLSRSGSREPERQLSQGREGSDGLEEPEGYTQKVRLDSGSQSSDEP